MVVRAREAKEMRVAESFILDESVSEGLWEDWKRRSFFC